jgi:curved DNA-binding protein CbpA
MEQIFISRGTGIRGRLVSWAGRKLFGFLLKKLLGKAGEPNGDSDLDLAFALPVDREEASKPTVKEVSYRLDGKTETLRVKIPSWVWDGMMLRLRGKGKRRKNQAGDLYLKIHLQ